ncbi:hypothetical protein [Actinophytocola glycyrrhizae]|uniref:Uncharacterized protein n=1 Tax=Actinophytocola glycyrrhizae TaxID=2044873 RepID=A0ABV9RZE0_9PSEU
MCSVDPESQVVVAASAALTAMQAGMAEPAVPDEHARDVMSLLFHECSAMVAALGAGGTAPVKMQVYDNAGNEVPIDEADPPVRTAVRVLLAEVHGDSESARAHIEIALTNAAPEEMDMLMVQALRWTMRLSDECVRRDLPVADWITTALS